MQNILNDALNLSFNKSTTNSRCFQIDLIKILHLFLTGIYVYRMEVSNTKWGNCELMHFELELQYFFLKDFS